MNDPGRWHLGSFAGMLLRLFGRRPKVTHADLRKAEFPTSTQRMGVRFTDKLRDSFRHRWLKKR
jgi:hypothetical protein